ncbi:MAG: ATPase [Alphaproteobacteria bacterium]|nr:ATPase [Alphaproteobacteria bacterium]
MIELSLITPLEKSVFRDVAAVEAQGSRGRFAMLPRHIDMTEALGVSILAWRAGGKMKFAGLDEGVIVKAGSRVSVSSRRVIMGESLSDLKARVKKEFFTDVEEEKKLKSVLSAMEAGLSRLFAELRHG